MKRLRGLVCGLAARLAFGAPAAFADSYTSFFVADNSAYRAYIDYSDHTSDAAGHRLVAVKLTDFSAVFRDWMAKNFPGSHDANYALDPYSVDCAAREVAEHKLEFYDANSLPITGYDFGGKMETPIPKSMKSFLVSAICGG